MLQSYAPDIDLSVIEKLSTAFMDLRAMQDSGDLLYPCVAISCLFPASSLWRVSEDRGMCAQVLDAGAGEHRAPPVGVPGGLDGQDAAERAVLRLVR